MTGITAIQSETLAQLEGADTRVAAFFDLDHTVLHGSSGMLFARYMWGKGVLRSRDLLSVLRVALEYSRGKADFTASTRKMMSLVAGWPVEDMWRITGDWFQKMIAPRITPEARRRVAEHRRLGHQVALLSASSPFATVPAAELLGLKKSDAICTHLEIVDGKLTGEVVEPMCYAEGKLYWARQWIGDREIDLGRSYFYTDSHSDLPMLRAVGHPVAVNPNRRLRRVACKEGWPIVRFY